MLFFIKQNLRILFGVLMLISAQASHAAPFSISDANAVFNQNKLAVDARFNLHLNASVVEALQAGIPIKLNANLDLFKSKPYLWDERIARWAFAYEIRYHSLTNRYLLQYLGLNQKNKSTGSDSYSSLADVFDELENFSFQSDILSDTLPSSKHGYKLQLQISLDRAALPTPLRVLSYVRKTWRLKSKVHEWTVDSP